MKFEFKTVKNGLILLVTHWDNEVVEYTYTDPIDDFGAESQEISRFHEFLWLILENYGPSTSRHSKERIVIRVEPGDKYESENN